MRNIMLVFAGIICSSSSVLAMYGYNYQNQMQQRPSVNANGELTFPNGVVDISGNEFAGNTQLKKIVLPNDVKRVGYSSFANCTNVTSIQLSTNLREIDDNAFAGLSKVRDLVIPASVTRIGQDALSGMSLHSLWFCDPDNCNVEELGNTGIARFTNYKVKGSSPRYQMQNENISHNGSPSKMFDHSAGASTTGVKHSFARSAQHDGKFSDSKGRENVPHHDTQSKKSDHLCSTNTTGKKYSLGYPSQYDSNWRDRAVLALQNAGILDQNGKLTEHAMLYSHQIMDWEKLDGNTRGELFNVDKNANWCKYATKGIQFDGCKGKLEVHFYMDEKTKKLYLDRDYKLKDNDYKPLRFQTKYNNPKNGDAEKSKPAQQSKTVAEPKSQPASMPKQTTTPASKTQPASTPKQKHAQTSKTQSTPKVQLKTLEIPSCITAIKDYTYWYDKAEKVVIPDSVTSIGEQAFAYCPDLREISLGARLTSIGDGFLTYSRYCRITVRDGVGKERVKQLLINAGISADRINK